MRFHPIQYMPWHVLDETMLMQIMYDKLFHNLPHLICIYIFSFRWNNTMGNGVDPVLLQHVPCARVLLLPT